MNHTFFQIRLPIFFLLAMGLLSHYSCNKASWEEDFETEVVFRGPLGQTEILERKMQWASFISAKIFCESEDARNEVITQLDGGNAEHIDHLIGENSYTPIFRQLFIDWVYHYQYAINQNGKPSFNELIPFAPDSTDASVPKFTDVSDSTGVSDYINYLTKENCIELFFPNGLAEDDNPEDYSSTAHPLVSGINENYGFRRSCEGDPSVIHATPSVEVDAIDQSYVNAGYTVIVARPYRIEGNPICEYSEYATIDFTLFLNP